jgi:DNA-binding NarL/FixJ family response regulator
MHILLVDDHTLFREALLHVLNQLDEKIFVLEASDTLEATQIISQTRNLDLVLLDIDLPGIDGLTALPELRELAPSVPIVVLSGSENALDVQRALDNGSVGYIPKSCSSHEMLTALRIILQGDIFVPPRLMSKLGKHPSIIDKYENKSDTKSLLTSRQIEVLKLMADGLPNKSIARTLNLAEGTVKLHVSAIIHAFNAKNRTHAVTEALRLGIVSTDD